MRYDVQVHGPIPDGKVSVDGVEVKHVTFADEESGIVKAIAADEDGRKQIDRQTMEPVVHMFTGNVEIVCSPVQRERIELSTP